MGLDMYLTRKVYVGARYTHRNVSTSVNICVDGVPLNIHADKITYVDEEIGYWRKANAIHGWFVDNVQNEFDDCSSHHVSQENLAALKTLCLMILNEESKEKQKELAQELLPPSDGFFFGNYEIDEYYLENLRDTVEIIQECEKYPNDEFEYRASW